MLGLNLSESCHTWAFNLVQGVSEGSAAGADLEKLMKINERNAVQRHAPHCYILLPCDGAVLCSYLVLPWLTGHTASWLRGVVSVSHHIM